MKENYTRVNYNIIEFLPPIMTEYFNIIITQFITIMAKQRGEKRVVEEVEEDGAVAAAAVVGADIANGSGNAANGKSSLAGAKKKTVIDDLSQLLFKIITGMSLPRS